MKYIVVTQYLYKDDTPGNCALKVRGKKQAAKTAAHFEEWVKAKGRIVVKTTITPEHAS